MIIYGNIVEEDGAKPGILEFENGKITIFTRNCEEYLHENKVDRAFPISSHIIFPGFVDLGALCHFEDETYSSAAIAALNGGITTLVDTSESYPCSDSAIDILSVPNNYDIVTSVAKLFEGRKTCVAITPHHLFFNSNMAKKEYLISDPPLPSKEEQRDIFNHLDLFDYIVSNHTPYHALDKIKGKLPGVPALDTFGSFIVWLIKEEKADIPTIFDLVCRNPGKMIKEATGRNVGRLTVDSEASITVIDMSKTADTGRQIMSKAGWSPFDLRFMPGVVDVVYYKGEKVVDGRWLKNFSKIS